MLDLLEEITIDHMVNLKEMLILKLLPYSLEGFHITPLLNLSQHILVKLERLLQQELSPINKLEG